MPCRLPPRRLGRRQRELPVSERRLAGRREIPYCNAPDQQLRQLSIRDVAPGNRCGGCRRPENHFLQGQVWLHKLLASRGIRAFCQYLKSILPIKERDWMTHGWQKLLFHSFIHLLPRWRWRQHSSCLVPWDRHWRQNSAQLLDGPHRFHLRRWQQVNNKKSKHY